MNDTGPVSVIADYLIVTFCGELLGRSLIFSKYQEKYIDFVESD